RNRTGYRGEMHRLREESMKASFWHWRRTFATGVVCAVIGAAITLTDTPPQASAEPPFLQRLRRPARIDCSEGIVDETVGGSWYWVRSPEEEKRVVMGLFNRYCIRCHGGDGRGVWDIPDVPDFTNPRWQASRVDGQLARAIIEGRGSAMPPWRGALSLEEAWAMARHIRTFVPGTEASRPDYGTPVKPSGSPAPKPIPILPLIK